MSEQISNQNSLSIIINNEKKIKQFEKKGLYTIEDLLNFYPRKYEDHRNTVTPIDIEDKEICTMILHIEDIRKRSNSVIAKCVERKSGIPVDVVWFNMSYIYDKILNLFNMDVLVSGRYSVNNYGKQFVNPSVFSPDIQSSMKIVPIYKHIPGMSADYLEDTISKAIEWYQTPDYLTEQVRNAFELIPQEDLYKAIHFPQDINDIEDAKRRVIFDDLYKFAATMENVNQNVQTVSSCIPYVLTNCNKLIKMLPYSLTSDQKQVISTIINTARTGKRVNALIQGDVGCGKTITAFLIMVAMADNGYQSVLMAPTGVLARQHFEELNRYVSPLGLSCAFLSSGMKAKEKRSILKQIKTGEVDFIIGTHACLNNDVEYSNLGLTIVDEEHKFGVKQRESLKLKSNTGVHSISMSATPIPRTLAMSMYSGTVDIFTIHSMPNGRKPVKTAITNDDNQIFDFLKKEIDAGHQCYVVCPLITTAETQTVDNDEKIPPISVEDAYDLINSYFEKYNIHTCYITGKTKEEEKTQIINAFQKNMYQILIATTIIEVGVNVPNATVITIMNADRFGLAGLHQLRGRVGRSDLQSYCILKSDDYNNPRLQAMCNTSDGFKIAEIDLSLRGTGDFLGTKQSGDNYYVELMMRYPDLYNKIKELVHRKDELQFS